MDWQLLLVGVLVLLSLVYLGRQTLRTWHSQRAGCGSCKCPGSANKSHPITAATTLIPLDQVRLRRR